MEQTPHKMRLARFIREEQERIIEEFEDFARTHTDAGDTMDILELRDHAAGMLADIALDIEQPQSDADEGRQTLKCSPDGPADTPAEKHGRDRADSGFSLQEMIAEYRALRASVLRLWSDDHGALDETDVHDLIRFNKAMDMALAQSITKFSTGLDHSREMFLAILGHDLRTPLNAIVTASSFLTTNGRITGRDLSVAKRIHSSGKRMSGLVGDLLDFTRSRLGKGIPVTPMRIDLADIGQEAVDECRELHPTGELRFEVSGNLLGEWDPSRVNQALCNLIANAAQHGTASTSIVVTARGEADEAVVSIHNVGRVIAAEDQARIFDPFKRIASADSDGSPQGSMGLGLYIAKQIALAHGGFIRVRSSVEEGTTFALHLPRQGPG